jgi:hypothetical protein
MLITDYTSYDQIRAVIGLSAQELTDTQLALEIYGNALELYLDSVTLPTATPGPGPLKSRFIEIDELDAEARTAKEQKLYSMTKLLSAYAVAVEVAVALPMLAPKMISDSKASLTRFSPEATFRDVIHALRSRLSELKVGIENINSTTVNSLPYATFIKPAVDVVTNS